MSDTDDGLPDLHLQIPIPRGYRSGSDPRGEAPPGWRNGDIIRLRTTLRQDEAGELQIIGYRTGPLRRRRRLGWRLWWWWNPTQRRLDRAYRRAQRDADCGCYGRDRSPNGSGAAKGDERKVGEAEARGGKYAGENPPRQHPG